MRTGILLLYAGTHRKLFSVSTSCTVADDSSCYSLAGQKVPFLQHSLNRSHIPGECVQFAEFSSNKRNLGGIPPF